ncbi:HAD family hydrolase [Butyrivibrio sp. MC2013]|uniref:HAD family hydrolase n=1 Tax=Butyrivibrio sp. MC2013 TaxID=1280686 RepID=UPI000419563F|nr:HAD family phosphatase [Butyrivibrio sp. MC2013]
MSDNKNKWTFKRIAALVGVVLLVGMYLALLVTAFIIPEKSLELFFGAIGVTVAVPIMLWIIIWMAGVLTGRHTIASLDAMTSNMDHDKYGNPIPREPSGRITTIIFDLGNVLIDFSWKEMLLAKGIKEEDIDRFGKATVLSKDWPEIDRGVMEYKDILGLFKKNDPEIADEIDRVFADHVGIVASRPGSADLIKALKKAHYHLYFLSNFSKQALEANRDVMSIIDMMDGGILSYKEKLIKPDPAIYELLIKRYDLDPSRCVFIDDTLPNVEAARKLGIEAIHYQTLDQVLAELKKLGVK